MARHITGNANFRQVASCICRTIRARCSTDSQQTKTVILKHLSGTQDGVATVGFNRPNARNAINFDLLNQLQEALSLLTWSHGVKVIVLRSLVPGIFCAGADLKERYSLSDVEFRRWRLTLRSLVSQLADIPIATIAALDGAALGGGLEVALACDIRVIATGAKVGLPETGLAILPGAGGTQRLPRLIGVARAKELIFTGRKLNSCEAVKIGLANHVVSQNQSGDAAFLASLQISDEIKQNKSRDFMHH